MPQPLMHIIPMDGATANLPAYLVPVDDTTGALHHVWVHARDDAMATHEATVHLTAKGIPIRTVFPAEFASS